VARSAPTAETARRRERVVAVAVLRAAATLGLNQRDLAEILGVSEASVSRLGRGRPIDPASKEGELALHFVRVYRSLDALLGGDEARCRAWLHAPNRHVGGVPSERIRSIEGLVHVAEYLDAMRGKS